MENFIRLAGNDNKTVDLATYILKKHRRSLMHGALSYCSRAKERTADCMYTYIYNIVKEALVMEYEATRSMRVDKRGYVETHVLHACRADEST